MSSKLLGPLLKSGSHIKVDVLNNVLSALQLSLLKLLIAIIALIASIVFLIAGIEATNLYFKLGQVMELEIEIPIWWVYLAFPTGFGLLAFSRLSLYWLSYCRCAIIGGVKPMYSLAIFSSIVLLLMSVPIFLVFGIGSSAAAILGLGLPWSTLIQVSFGAMTKHILVAVPLFIFAGMVMLRGALPSVW